MGRIIAGALMNFNVDLVSIMKYNAILTDVALAHIPKMTPLEQSIINNLTHTQVVSFAKASLKQQDELSKALKLEQCELHKALHAHQMAASHNVPAPPLPPDSPVNQISIQILEYLVDAARHDMSVLAF